MNARLILLSLVGVLSAACSSASDEDPRTEPSPLCPDAECAPTENGVATAECSSFQYADPAGLSNEVKRIRALVDATPDCLANGNQAGCEEVDLPLEAAQPWCRSVGQRMLIVDGDADLAVYRHAKRVLGYYTVDANTLDMVPVQPHLRVQRPLANIVAEMAKSQQFLPSMAFNSPSLPSGGSGRLKVKTPRAGHGAMILVNLADYNPYAQFVLFEPSHWSRHYACDGSVESVKHALARNAEHIAHIKQKFGIDFVNYSKGEEDGLIRDAIRAKCGQVADDDLVHRIHVAITEYEGRISAGSIFVKAGNPWSDTPVTGTEPQLLSDCTARPNGIRVGYAVQYESNVPLGGQPLSQSTLPIDSGQRNLSRCLDMYINTGWEEGFPRGRDFGPYPVFYGSFGYGGGPLSFMATSWAAPVGLSIANHARQNWLVAHPGQRPSPEEIVSKLNPTGPEPRVFDPLRNQGFETCRMYPIFCKSRYSE
ncbi:hypothetical protein [Pendulispora albinea]|uniref:Uncharacterized protein n=1 Tax=Pendulispora albinea TaxID=2741071 RepID=A0ABZ2M4P6_9BACT